MSDVTDPGELATVFGIDGGRLIHRWAEHTGRTVRLAGPGALTGGFTDARLAVVHVTQRYGPPRKCVLKYCPPDADGPPREPQAHESALREAPPKFAARRLVRQMFEPVLVPDDGVLVFQELAFGSSDEHTTLAVLFGGERQATAASRIVRSILADWNPEPGLARLTVTAFLRQLLGRRLEPGHGLATWRDRYPALADRNRWLRIDGSPLPNPFALVAGELLAVDSELSHLVGRAHGDLHAGNILLPREHGTADPAGYRLIDLSTYDSAAPLTRDPAHLLLSIVAADLPAGDRARRGLADLLVRETGPDRGAVPVALADTVPRVWDAGREWARTMGLLDEWTRQTLLSLVAGALIVTGRDTVDSDARWWFFTLAARSTRAYLRAERHPDAPADPADVHEAVAPSTADPLRVRPSTPEPLGARQATVDATGGPNLLPGRPRTVDVAQLTRLLDLLFREPALGTPGTWQLVLDLLAPTGLADNLVRTGVPRQECLALMLRFGGYPDADPWRHLRDVLNLVLAGAPVVREFTAELCRLDLLRDRPV